MKRVTGIGGVFFKAKDPEALRAWYQKHLGIDSQQWGASFDWKTEDNLEAHGSTAWCPFKQDSKKFEPSSSPFMINYRVADMDALLKVLKEDGVTVLDAEEDKDFGKFGWILDLEGNKIELWEPPAGM